MVWNYRLVQIESACIRLCEVYYNDDMKPESYCDATIQGEDLDEAKADFENARRALKLPILTNKDFK